MKVTAPLFSLDASGSIGGAIVASKWKGRNYMRRLVTPANPRSMPQVSNRGMFGFLGAAWANIDPLLQAEWDAIAAQTAISPFNAYVRAGQREWTQFRYPFQAPSVESSGTADTVATVTALGGVGQISGTIAMTGIGVDVWANAIWLNTTNDNVIAKQDLKLVLENLGDTTLQYVISGLEPGTYYVKSNSFTIGGVPGAVNHSTAAAVT